ncbi:hypothetical protein D3C73_767410 [compost metagenome]
MKEARRLPTERVKMNCLILVCQLVDYIQVQCISEAMDVCGYGRYLIQLMMVNVKV